MTIKQMPPLKIASAEGVVFERTSPYVTMEDDELQLVRAMYCGEDETAVVEDSPSALVYTVQIPVNSLPSARLVVAFRPRSTASPNLTLVCTALAPAAVTRITAQLNEISGSCQGSPCVLQAIEHLQTSPSQHHSTHHFLTNTKTLLWIVELPCCKLIT
eukprot:c17771_g1_i1.p2 GENE.c17771_g1_i1~~c17771_g1_i1.p2  ORF type:complete len:159 (+),score=29.29 c17771_g1_i1:793-1269(+)